MSWWQQWSLRRKVFVAILILIPIIALAIGLGVGLSEGRSSESGGSSPNTTLPSNVTNSTASWRPRRGTTWQYLLSYPVNDTSVDVEVWDIDLFDNEASTVDNLHGQGKKVICYFSAGSYENWRPDKDKFKSSDMGKALHGWQGEKWLDTNSANVRNIMESRLDTAAQKKCDGVDPDNVDAYDNDNGLGLTNGDAMNYIQFLADAAHSRNLSIGLKNAVAVIPNVIGQMEWSVNEQCVEYNECLSYQSFISQDKPVFHVEYPKGDSIDNNVAVSADVLNKICNNSDAAGFSTIIKNMALDNWLEICPET